MSGRDDLQSAVCTIKKTIETNELGIAHSE